MSRPEDFDAAVALGREYRQVVTLLEHAIAELLKARVPLTPLLENWRLRCEVEQQAQRAEHDRRVKAILDKAPSRAQRDTQDQVISAARVMVSSLPARR
jgi:hypothetical protein